MHFECRICMKISNSVMDIFSDGLSTKIKAISSVEILPDYGFSITICDDCVESVHCFYNFREKMIKYMEMLEAPNRIRIIKAEDSLESECRTCLTVTKNVTDVFCDGLPHKIEIISSLEVTQDDRFSSKICMECEKIVCSLYEFRTMIITNNATMSERVVKEEREIDVKEIILEDATLHVNDLKRGGTIVTPILDGPGSKKKIYMYRCSHCKFVTPHYLAWRKHNKIHHESDIVCEICGILVCTSRLTTHLRSHTIREKVSCPVCGMTLKHEDTLKTHLKRHTKVDQFECPKCKKLYKSKSSYRKHLNIHAGKVKNVKCSMCDRYFFDKSKLDVHFRSHTGERPFVCDICSKGFSSTNALKTHIRQHTQEKPYTCRYCDAAFKQAVLVRRHMKSKHPEKVEEKSGT